MKPLATFWLGIALILITGAILAPATQPAASLPPGAALDATLNALSTQVSGLEARVAVLESSPVVQPTATPTATVTPTATRTPTATNTQAVPFTPTPEGLTSTFTRTPTFALGTNTPTRTHTPAPVGTASPTLLPALDINYTCQMQTTTALTRRLTPSPSATSLGVVPAGTTVTVYPYRGTILYSTNASYWYLEIHENSGGGYLAYGQVAAPSEATPGITPPLISVWMQPASFPCIPLIVRN